MGLFLEKNFERHKLLLFKIDPRGQSHFPCDDDLLSITQTPQEILETYFMGISSNNIILKLDGMSLLSSYTLESQVLTSLELLP